MTKCVICSNPAVGEWVNPNNPNDRAYYCAKHLKAISESFGKFQELHYYENNIRQKPEFVIADDEGGLIMGPRTYIQSEEKYKAEVERLTVVASGVVNSGYCKFFRTLADAWLQADKDNKRILKPAWEAIVMKYSLREGDEE